MSSDTYETTDRISSSMGLSEADQSDLSTYRQHYRENYYTTWDRLAEVLMFVIGALVLVLVFALTAIIFFSTYIDYMPSLLLVFFITSMIFILLSLYFTRITSAKDTHAWSNLLESKGIDIDRIGNSYPSYPREKIVEILQQLYRASLNEEINSLNFMEHVLELDKQEIAEYKNLSTDIMDREDNRFMILGPVSAALIAIPSALATLALYPLLSDVPRTGSLQVYMSYLGSLTFLVIAASLTLIAILVLIHVLISGSFQFIPADMSYEEFSSITKQINTLIDHVPSPDTESIRRENILLIIFLGVITLIGFAGITIPGFYLDSDQGIFDLLHDHWFLSLILAAVAMLGGIAGFGIYTMVYRPVLLVNQVTDFMRNYNPTYFYAVQIGPTHPKVLLSIILRDLDQVDFSLIINEVKQATT